jgi:hypothetical protein
MHRFFVLIDQIQGRATVLPLILDRQDDLINLFDSSVNLFGVGSR